MDIHGKDIVLNYPPNIAIITNVVRKSWPEMTTEQDGEHLFLYKDKKSQHDWDKNGWTKHNDTSMIYVILNKTHVSFTIDDKGQNKPIITAIAEELKREKSTF